MVPRHSFLFRSSTGIFPESVLPTLRRYPSGKGQAPPESSLPLPSIPDHRSPDTEAPRQTANVPENDLAAGRSGLPSRPWHSHPFPCRNTFPPPADNSAEDICFPVSSDTLCSIPLCATVLLPSGARSFPLIPLSYQPTSFHQKILPLK